mmetsp:Transcript_24465/g.92409  ORF Transcript_24465/g.92409 Transcript_24465/m.92409 type:complete len:253 (-) Transcript_24465:1051-1809(-)
MSHDRSSPTPCTRIFASAKIAGMWPSRAASMKCFAARLKLRLSTAAPLSRASMPRMSSTPIAKCASLVPPSPPPDEDLRRPRARSTGSCPPSPASPLLPPPLRLLVWGAAGPFPPPPCSGSCAGPPKAGRGDSGNAPSTRKARMESVAAWCECEGRSAAQSNDRGSGAFKTPARRRSSMASQAAALLLPDPAAVSSRSSAVWLSWSWTGSVSSASPASAGGCPTTARTAAASSGLECPLPPAVCVCASSVAK